MRSPTGSVPPPPSSRATPPSPTPAWSEHRSRAHRGEIMSVSVRIPTILRTYTHGESEVKADGSTLSEVLESLDSSYPGIKARILDDQGSIRRFVNVYVGNDDVRFLDALDTSTPEGTQVSVIPAVAGG